MVSRRRLKESKGVHMYETRKNKEKFKICENHEFIYWKNGLADIYIFVLKHGEPPYLKVSA